ncbi:hypothetical protein V1511DRAFT_499031 [Dipodascopsis uninucleata]
MASNNIFSEVPAAPRLTLTQDERTLYGQLFKSLDGESLGIVTGEVARSLFEKSGLSPLILGRIWQIADDENNGFLNQTGFAIAMRLIAYVQNGQRLTPELATRPGPLPVFDQDASAPKIPPINSNDKARFGQLFESSATDGLLAGDQAREIFLRARLPTDVLGKIWNIADTHRRGGLDLTEFIVAMHLIQCKLNGTLEVIPATVPSSLFTQASTSLPPPSGAVRSSSRTSTRGTTQIQPPPPRQRGQYVEQNTPIPVQPTGGNGNFSATAAPVALQQTGSNGDWLITPQQKVHFDGIFTTVDREKRGFIGGEIAVPFFKTSKLPDDVLAQIWDLSDIRNSGELSMDEFAVAMYLVQQKLIGNELPSTLPASLVPPALRQSLDPNPVFFPGSVPVPQQASKQASSIPAPAQSHSAIADLFDLDDSAFSAPSNPPSVTSTSAIASPISTTSPEPVRPSSTGFNAAQPGLSTSSSGPPPTTFGAAISPLSPTLTGRAPFVPTSSFGQSIQQGIGSNGGSKPQSPALTGATASPTVPAAASPSPSFIPQPSGPPATSFGQAVPASVKSPVSSSSQGGDLLLDEAEINTKLSKEKSEFTQISGQIASLTTQTQELKEKRAKAESELKRMATLKHDIETRLNQLRGVYENEVEKVHAVEQKLAESTNETNELRQQLSLMETNVHDIQVQYQEIMSNLETDQNENATLKEKIRLVQEQTEQVKEAIERAKSDARQQKGLVAINKKQLASAEVDRDTSQRELDRLKASSTELARAETLSRATSPNNPFLGFSQSPIAGDSASHTQNAGDVNESSNSQQSIFTSMFAGFEPPATSSPSVDQSSTNSSQNRSNFEDEDEEAETQFGSSPATTTTATTTNIFSQTGILTGVANSSALATDSMSVSSSVQNNAPESVREGISRPETPTGDKYTSSLNTIVTADEESGTIATTAGVPDEKAKETTEDIPNVSDSTIEAENTAVLISQNASDTTDSANSLVSAIESQDHSVEDDADPFALRPKKKDTTPTKEEFDAVFSDLGFPSKSSEQSRNEVEAAPTQQHFNAEFPPIEELEIYDDSASSEVESVNVNEGSNSAQTTAKQESAQPETIETKGEEVQSPEPEKKQMQDSFDAMFASFTAPANTSGSSALSAPISGQSAQTDDDIFNFNFNSFSQASEPTAPQAAGPPLPPKVPIGGNNGSGEKSVTFDDFDKVFNELQDAKITTDGTKGESTKSFTDDDFESFGKEFSFSH